MQPTSKSSRSPPTRSSWVANFTPNSSQNLSNHTLCFATLSLPASRTESPPEVPAQLQTWKLPFSRRGHSPPEESAASATQVPHFSILPCVRNREGGSVCKL